MGLWNYLLPEEREEVLDVLRQEIQHDELIAGVCDLLVSDPQPDNKTRRESFLRTQNPRWHRLRSEWLRAAILELGGDVRQHAEHDEP